MIYDPWYLPVTQNLPTSPADPTSRFGRSSIIASYHRQCATHPRRLVNPALMVVCIWPLIMLVSCCSRRNLCKLSPRRPAALEYLKGSYFAAAWCARLADTVIPNCLLLPVLTSFRVVTEPPVNYSGLLALGFYHNYLRFSRSLHKVCCRLAELAHLLLGHDQNQVYKLSLLIRQGFTQKSYVMEFIMPGDGAHSLVVRELKPRRLLQPLSDPAVPLRDRRVLIFHSILILLPDNCEHLITQSTHIFILRGSRASEQCLLFLTRIWKVA